MKDSQVKADATIISSDLNTIRVAKVVRKRKPMYPMVYRITLGCIKPHKQTADVCADFVEEDWRELRFVAPDLLTPELCEIALAQSWQALAYCKQTPELCRRVAKDNPGAYYLIEDDEVAKEFEEVLAKKHDLDYSLYDLRVLNHLAFHGHIPLDVAILVIKRTWNTKLTLDGKPVADVVATVIPDESDSKTDATDAPVDYDTHIDFMCQKVQLRC